MVVHGSARLGLAGRLALVQTVEPGMSLKAAAAAFNVSPATAHRWWHRWRPAGERARRSLSCLLDRSSGPRHSPRELAPELQERIVACRRQSGWGPRLIAGATGLAHSTVWKVLRRAGISRRQRAANEPANSYQWPCPGDLPHMDVCPATPVSRGPAAPSPATAARPPRKHEPESATTRRTRSSATAHARPTSGSTPTRERPPSPASSNAPLALYEQHGIRAKRLMTDNAFAYTKNRSLRELLTSRGIRHLTTQPYRPRTNGKLERFHQTMAPERAHGLSYRSHHHRNHALPHWLHHYNHRRPHSSTENRPPINRAHNVRRQDN